MAFSTTSQCNRYFKSIIAPIFFWMSAFDFPERTAFDIAIPAAIAAKYNPALVNERLAELIINVVMVCPFKIFVV